jgi:hypothetical protein
MRDRKGKKESKWHRQKEEARDSLPPELRGSNLSEGNPGCISELGLAVRS